MTIYDCKHLRDNKLVHREARHTRVGSSTSRRERSGGQQTIHRCGVRVWALAVFSYQGCLLLWLLRLRLLWLLLLLLRLVGLVRRFQRVAATVPRWVSRWHGTSVPHVGCIWVFLFRLVCCVTKRCAGRTCGSCSRDVNMAWCRSLWSIPLRSMVRDWSCGRG